MFEDVKPGDPIPLLASFWNNLKTMVRARRLLAGVDVRLREMPFGTIVNFDADPARPVCNRFDACLSLKPEHACTVADFPMAANRSGHILNIIISARGMNGWRISRSKGRPVKNPKHKHYNIERDCRGIGGLKGLHVSDRYIRILRKAGAPFPLGKSRPEWILEWLRDNSGHDYLRGKLGL